MIFTEATNVSILMEFKQQALSSNLHMHVSDSFQTKHTSVSPEDSSVRCSVWATKITNRKQKQIEH